MTGFGINQDYSTDTAPLIVFRIKLRMQKWALKSGKGPSFMWVDHQVPNWTVCSFQLATSSKEPRKAIKIAALGARFCFESMNQCCFPSGNASTSQGCYRAAALSTAQWQGTLPCDTARTAPMLRNQSAASTLLALSPAQLISGQRYAWAFKWSRDCSEQISWHLGI